MNLNKPKFWDFKKPNFLAYLLLPLTLFVKANIFSTFYTKKNLKKSNQFVLETYIWEELEKHLQH